MSDLTFTEEAYNLCDAQNERILSLNETKIELENEIIALKNALAGGGENFKKIKEENIFLKHELEKIKNQQNEKKTRNRDKLNLYKIL